MGTNSSKGGETGINKHTASSDKSAMGYFVSSEKDRALFKNLKWSDYGTRGVDSEGFMVPESVQGCMCHPRDEERAAARKLW